MTRHPLANRVRVEYDSGMHERTVIAAARKAAKARKAARAPLRWSEAMAEAKVPADVPPALTESFRRGYAAELVRRKLALPAAKSGGVSKSTGTLRLKRRQVNATEAEFREQDAKANTAGLSWSSWARRRLSE